MKLTEFLLVDIIHSVSYNKINSVKERSGCTMEESTFDKVYKIMKQIPKGKVATYGQIAAILEMSKGARTVGFALAACKDDTIPCHRVVDRFGGTKSAFAILE